jgi:DNA invertase Pin-like site-specific DNA recombinase
MQASSVTMTKKRVAIYCRVSTADQSTEMQLQDLRRFAESRNLEIAQEFTDSGISGAARKRPALDRLMDAARKRQFDMVAVWRFDRFARSTKHLLDALDEFRHLGIDFISYQENLDTSSPLGEAIFTIVAAVAQLERNIIIERVRAGVAKVRPTKTYWGRVPIEVKDPKKAREMERLRKEGRSIHAIARQVGLSSRTVWRVLNSSRSQVGLTTS